MVGGAFSELSPFFVSSSSETKGSSSAVFFFGLGLTLAVPDLSLGFSSSLGIIVVCAFDWFFAVSISAKKASFSSYVSGCGASKQGVWYKR
jgi:hypothetical protein